PLERVAGAGLQPGLRPAVAGGRAHLREVRGEDRRPQRVREVPAARARCARCARHPGQAGRAVRALVLAIVIALCAPAAAASHKVLVLPVDGTIDAATRTRLTADIARLARSLDGQVASGSATFADTALAVGCDPRAAGCSDEVMATLGVDELIWATATKEGSHTRWGGHRA